jgi:small multidrug resistance family-3 protein
MDNMTALAWLIFILAAVLEVSGDALIRKGLRDASMASVIIGFLILGCYGLTVNMVKWDFSRLLGVYVAVFALVSVLAGLFVFKERIPLGTWLGLALIVIGGMIIQFSPAS